MHSFIEIYIFVATIFIHQFVQSASIPQTEEVMAGEGSVITKSGRSSFHVDKRYPEGAPDTVPKLIVMKEKTIEFNCSSYDELTNCQWRGPFSNKPCQNPKGGSEDCAANVPEWSNIGNFQVRREQRNGYHTCSIHGRIGADVLKPEEGIWECRLETVLNSGDYVADRQKFEVQFLRPATVEMTTLRPHMDHEADIYETEEMEFTCAASNGLPQPRVLCSPEFRNRFSILSNEGPREDQEDSWSHTQRISYKAALSDAGEFLHCYSEQTDDQGSVTRHTGLGEAARFYLSVKMTPVTGAAVSASAIGAIIGFILLLVLLILLLAFAWHTRRWCFAKPDTVVVRTEDPEKARPEMYSYGTLTHMDLNETSRLLEHADMQTEAMDSDDPITRVTKYQTNLIMLADKLAQTPDSKKIASKTDELARATANLLKNMANTEEGSVKNRFLSAARGLTDSVGLLLTESDRCAANPADDSIRSAAVSALQQVKTESADALVLVRTILLLRQLEQAARAAVEAASTSMNVTREATNDNDLSEVVNSLDVVAKILEEKIENFSDKPSSADAQSYLLIGAKRFLGPSNKFIDESKHYIQSLGNEELVRSFQAAVTESEITTNALDAKINEAESNLLTLDVEVAAELIKNLISELENLKAISKSGQPMKQFTAEEAAQASEALSKSAKKVRWGLDEVFQFAIAGDKEGVSRAAKEAVPLVTKFRSNLGDYAASSGSPASQQIILDVGSEAVNNASVMINSAHRTVLNPNNPLVTMNFLKASNHVGKSMKAVMLSNPDTLVMSSHNLTKALGDELEEFRAALDDLKVKPIPGQFREVVSSHLKESDSAVKEKLNEVVTSALNADKNKTDIATSGAVLALDDYKNSTKEVATLITDRDIQHKIVDSAQEVIARSADMFLEAQNVLKTPGNQAAAEHLKEAVRHIAGVMKDLEKTYIFGAEGQEQYVSALNIMKYATKELAHPSPLGSNEKPEEVATIKTRLMTSTMEIAQLAQDILTRSHNDPEMLDGLTPRLAQQYKNLTGDINSLAGAVGEEDSEAGETRQLAVSLGENIVELIEQTCVQTVIPGHETRQAVAGRAGTVAECSVKLLTSVNTLAKKAQALDDITSSLSGLLNSLDTTIMFTTAGTLELEDAEAGNNTFGEHREDILRLAQVLVQDVQRLLMASTGTRAELTSAASAAHDNIGQLVEKIKAGAASLGSNNKETQVMLLNSAKDVSMSLHGLISQAKAANGHDVDHPAYNQVSDYSKGVIMNITNFLKSVKMFEDESSRGTRAVESSIEAIAQEIHEFSTDLGGAAGVEEASPEDVIRANRAITHATHKIVAASVSGRQEDLLAAANMGRRAVTELLTTCKGAAFACQDQELRQKTLGLCGQVAVQYRDLLRMIVTGEERTKVMETSRLIAQNALLLAGLAEEMKGDDLVNPEDPIVVAESELLNAAEAIEQAARNLETLRPRNQVGGQKVSYDDMTFDELIIDSAKSIANATSSLIKAASEAQKELVLAGAVAKEYHKGSEDGQWSEGLVSAAKLVASATHSLCDAANKLVRGEGAEELLIAAAKQVSKSTAQLVLACKVKAKEGSRAMEGLKTASDAVRRATDALVKAAQGSVQKPTSPRVKVDRFKQRIEAEARVIRLEKELEESRERQKEVQESSQRTVSDIKREREAEAEVMGLSKELEEARKFCLRLNEEEYNK